MAEPSVNISMAALITFVIKIKNANVCLKKAKK